ncbi:MAG: hypothetical protein FWD24_00835 [Treponema sp.]|nr:hypothetical protein [Treponema sp.]
MKIVLKLLSNITLIIIIGFFMISCGDNAGEGINNNDLIQGKLTITNFTGSNGLTTNNFIIGVAENGTVFLEFRADTIDKGVEVKGNSITLDVWEYDPTNWSAEPKLFTGNVTMPIASYPEPGAMGFGVNGIVLIDANNNDNIWAGFSWDYLFINKTAIVFTNGNAIINFGTQMEVWD